MGKTHVYSTHKYSVVEITMKLQSMRQFPFIGMLLNVCAVLDLMDFTLILHVRRSISNGRLLCHCYFARTERVRKFYVNTSGSVCSPSILGKVSTTRENHNYACRSVLLNRRFCRTATNGPEVHFTNKRQTTYVFNTMKARSGFHKASSRTHASHTPL